jgi:SAM-dependent methyltransferase
LVTKAGTNLAAEQILAEIGANANYVRERLDPKCGDGLYLCLSDLRLAMEREATAEVLRILDFGAGPSPYRSLFPNCDYRRADLAGNGLDYIIDADGRINEQPESFDMILSTQVFEHVYGPAAYLRECYRLLKSGGKLVLSTHGSYEDHGCPYDFQRWTADGIKRDLAEAGFFVESVDKLTCGIRAVAFLAGQCASAFDVHPVVRKWWLRLLKRVGLARMHSFLDRHTANLRMCSASELNCVVYIGLIARARRG